MPQGDAQAFAREVRAHALKLRGFDPETAPQVVRDDVAAMISRYAGLYGRWFERFASDPKGCATTIQFAEWEST